VNTITQKNTSGKTYEFFSNGLSLRTGKNSQKNELTPRATPVKDALKGGFTMRYLIILGLSFGLTSWGQSTSKVGFCDVFRVFAGKDSTFIQVTNCSKELGFDKMDFSIPHHRSIIIDEINGNMVERARFDNVGDVLGMKQTAELAYLFSQRLRVEVNPSNNLLFLSLAGQFIAPTTKEKPNCPPGNPQTTGDDGFRPVPTSPKHGLNLSKKTG
jgi:hypothetical protein